MLLTLVGTETPFRVVIIAVSGTAPQLAISSSLTCAGVILFTQEHEREVARLPLRVSTNHSGFCTNKEITKTVKLQAVVAALLSTQEWWFLSLTPTGTKSVCLVIVKVAGGGTPAVAVSAALRGTAVILLPQEDEGEDTLGSVSVSVNCVQNCQDDKNGRRMIR